MLINKVPYQGWSSIFMHLKKGELSQSTVNYTTLVIE